MAHIQHHLKYLETLTQRQVSVGRPTRVLLQITSTISIIVGVLLTLAALETLPDDSATAFVWTLFGWFSLWLGITTRRKSADQQMTISWQRAVLQIAPVLVLMGLVLAW